MPKKILVVEDSKEFLVLLKRGLEKKGFSVATAKDGRDGLAVAKKTKPDLILSDIVMPDMDGITMAEKLKQDGVCPPVIFLTNLMDIKHIKDAFGSNLDIDYIVKPDANIENIINKVKKKLEDNNKL